MTGKINIEIIPKNNSVDIKHKYHNDFKWVLFGRRIQRNPFIKGYLLNKYNSKCLWCGKYIRNSYVIHHVDYDNICSLNEVITIPYVTKYGKQTVRNVPNCEKCFVDQNVIFNNCIDKLVPVHQRCNKSIYDYMCENIEYIFKKLDEMDLPIIFKLSKEIILNNYNKFLNINIIENYISSKQYVKDIVKDIENCIVMKYGNKIIGFSTISENRINIIMIEVKYQNKKHGTHFLKYLENNLFKEYDELNLESFKDNKIANSFYEKNGWEKNGESEMNGIILNKYKKKKIK